MPPIVGKCVCACIYLFAKVCIKHVQKNTPNTANTVCFSEGTKKLGRKNAKDFLLYVFLCLLNFELYHYQTALCVCVLVCMYMCVSALLDWINVLDQTSMGSLLPNTWVSTLSSDPMKDKRNRTHIVNPWERQQHPFSQSQQWEERNQKFLQINVLSWLWQCMEQDDEHAP